MQCRARPYRGGARLLGGRGACDEACHDDLALMAALAKGIIAGQEIGAGRVLRPLGMI